MTVVVHVARVSIVQVRNGVQVAEWREYSFHPTGASSKSHTGAFAMVRNGSQPRPLKVPHGSNLTDDGLFLRTNFSPWGLDAKSCHHLAEKGDRLFGFADVPPAVECVEIPAAAERAGQAFDFTEAPPAVERANPTAPTGRAGAELWGVAFGSGRYVSFLARRGPCIRSTISLGEIESWPDRSGPEGWIRASGLDPQHIPIGTGLVAFAALIPANSDELRFGIQFELTSRSPAIARRPERPARPAAVQATFAF